MGLDSTKLQMGPANVYFDDVHLGYLGEDLSIEIASEVSPLTGAQAGTSPLDKVVTGGSVRITLPLKQITPELMATGILNAVLVTGAVSGTRVDITNRVGLSARSLAKRLEIRSILGGIETVDPAFIYVCPEASPADSTVTIPFSPTEQRVIEVTFEVWPNASTGRWMYLGDETPV